TLEEVCIIPILPCFRTQKCDPFLNKDVQGNREARVTAQEFHLLRRCRRRFYRSAFRGVGHSGLTSPRRSHVRAECRDLRKVGRRCHLPAHPGDPVWLFSSFFLEFFPPE